MTSNLEDTYTTDASAPAPTPPPDTGDQPKVALVVAAHPDDADFGAAGTAHLWTKEGWEFYYLVCTDGSKGTEDPSLTADRLVPMRQREQRAAAEVLGVKDVFFLDQYVDGELTKTREFLGDVVRVIRTVRPYAVFTHEPSQLFHRNAFVNHSDHRATGLTTVDAVYPAARDRWNYPEQIDEGLQTHKVKELFIWGNDDPNFDVDITDAVETKIQALLRHTSQFGEGEEFLKFVRERWKDDDGRYKERFRRITFFR
jgi:LmbE family N-acetylglucosaminyl deacetylase